jgi:hypothetical protein
LGRGSVHESSAVISSPTNGCVACCGRWIWTKGIVAVVAGRELPRWADAPINPQDGKPTAPPASHLDTQLIGHLEPDDADEYLQSRYRRCRAQACTGPTGRSRTRTSPTASVGLCGDIALLAAQQGEPLDLTRFAAQLERCERLKPATDPRQF